MLGRRPLGYGPTEAGAETDLPSELLCLQVDGDQTVSRQQRACAVVCN